jgi:hypothetical protein
MKKAAVVLAACLFISAGAFAQKSPQEQKASPTRAIADGTILPVQLNTTLSVEKSAQGQAISGRIAQDVQLQNGHKLRAGTKVVGHIVRVTRGNPSQITFTFDKIQVTKDESLAVTTNLRALASYTEILTASTPKMGSDGGTPENAWNTTQVGGQALYGSATLRRGEQVLGHWVPGGGAVGKVEANGPCRGEVAGNSREQALWLFSTTACGVYGYPGVLIADAGRANPTGEITLKSEKSDFKVRSGSGLLLRVDNGARGAGSDEKSDALIRGSGEGKNYGE